MSEVPMANGLPQAEEQFQPEPRRVTAASMFDKAVKVVELKPKPIHFDGNRAHWPEFRFRMEGLADKVGDGLIDSMRAAMTASPEQVASLSPQGKEHAIFLYGILVDVCSGEALNTVRLVHDRNGLAVWRTLAKENEPQSSFQFLKW